MQINNIQRKTKLLKKAQVGRGGKRGKTSGRGTKGQNARAGRKKRPDIRDFLKTFPKQRGYSFNSIKNKPVVLNVVAIEETFNSGDIVSPGILMEKGLVSKISGKYPVIKILSEGDLTKKLNFVGCLVSEKTKEKIEKAGGTVK